MSMNLNTNPRKVKPYYHLFLIIEMTNVRLMRFKFLNHKLNLINCPCANQNSDVFAIRNNKFVCTRTLKCIYNYIRNSCTISF